MHFTTLHALFLRKKFFYFGYKNRQFLFYWMNHIGVKDFCILSAGIRIAKMVEGS